VKIPERQNEINALVAGYLADPKPERHTPTSPELEDEGVIALCRAAGNAEKFAALFDDGDVDAYHGGDDSSADLGLLSMLAFYTQDPDQLERIFSLSALGQREKWEREDYRRRTIDKALSGLTETYTPPSRRKHAPPASGPRWTARPLGASSGSW
jgi:putative DNA primase/helicase